MSASLIFDIAPIGSIVSWSDRTPRPPERHRKKLSAWKGSNSFGRLIRKQGQRIMGSVILPASFTLHEGDHGAHGVVVIRVHRSFSVNTNLRFTVLERPAIGSVRIFDRAGDNAELVHLAGSRQQAEEWLSRHGYPRAVMQTVSADEVAADSVEGRAA
ncbi:hypothetical protein [Mesorhizobium sp. CAU 1732]|uniref:hypothetical protein n=1 Tax=Mesorhizobium sp. CAU 1732 TaxID=3140358 RepID=UPI0032617CB4